MHNRPLIRHVARTVALATALTAVVAGVSATQPVAADGGLPAGSLAQYLGFDQRARFQNAEAELGRPLDRVVTMAANSTPANMRSSIWGQFADSSAYLPKLSDRLDVTVTIPLAFGKKAPYQKSGPAAVLAGLKKTTSGAYDSDFRSVARTLIAAGYSDAVLRLGHEFDGTWVQWSARDNEQGYIDAFRHVRAVFARESSAFRFEWTGMNATWRAHAPDAYPGDAYVDIIGLDIYYRSAGAISNDVWSRYEMNLEAHRDFAIKRGKPVSYPEWGRAFDDTDRFIGLMHGWFAGLPASGPGSLEYQAYFNEPGQRGKYDLDNHPNVKRRYLQLFRTTATGPADSPSPKPAQLDAPATLSTAIVAPSTPPTTENQTTTSPSASQLGISLVPLASALEVKWLDDTHDGRRNVRYRAVGANRWKWVSWKQPIADLSSGTAYEVQGRVLTDEGWQPWMTATATPR